jgi:predicted nucleic acid-binding protein
MKCFLEANVLFSAANEKSQMHRFINEISTRHTCLTSDYAREEAIRNIRAKRSDWEYGFSQIMAKLDVVQSIGQALEVEIALKDRPILATAIAQNCDRLITGDKRDCGHLFQKTVQGVKTLTPLQFAQELT